MPGRVGGGACCRLQCSTLLAARPWEHRGWSPKAPLGASLPWTTCWRSLSQLARAASRCAKRGPGPYLPITMGHTIVTRLRTAACFSEKKACVLGPLSDFDFQAAPPARRAAATVSRESSSTRPPEATEWHEAIDLGCHERPPGLRAVRVPHPHASLPRSRKLKQGSRVCTRRSNSEQSRAPLHPACTRHRP